MNKTWNKEIFQTYVVAKFYYNRRHSKAAILGEIPENLFGSYQTN